MAMGCVGLGNSIPAHRGVQIFTCISLSPLQISAVRLPREPTNPERLKGFGYAEFEDIDSLFQALSLNEEVSPTPVQQDRAVGAPQCPGSDQAPSWPHSQVFSCGAMAIPA